MKNNTMIPYNPKKDLETNYYNKTEVELLVAGGSGGSIDLSNYYKKLETYSKAQVDALVAGGGADLSDYYTKAEVESLISAIPETDLTNYYNKTQVDSLIDAIPETDLSEYYKKTETYSKTQLDAGQLDNRYSTTISTNITVNVGAGQTYTTINEALEYLSGFYPLYKKSGITATINLKAGFVMNEQVLVRGLNLGWITIVGEDAETIITHTALTTAFNGTHYPAFGVDKGGTSPVIGQLFRFNVEKVGGDKHGLMTYGAGSSADVLNGKGFIGAGTNGIYAVNASTVNANGANCSNAGTNGIYAVNASTVNANGANCSNAGTYGIYAVNASTVNANGANCSNAGTYGIYANSASTINAYLANASNAGTNGIFAVAGSTINAHSANCSNAGTSGIIATQASIINANGAIASGAGTYGIIAYTSSTINARSATIQNQTTGTARVVVQEGSHIEASEINTTGGTVPALSQTANTLTGNGIIYQ